MRRYFKFAVLIGLAALGSGCGSDAFRRADGLTNSAGNTMAANTVMQMVDPWQEGVQNTKLRVPAVRGSDSAGEASDATSSQPTSN